MKHEKCGKKMRLVSKKKSYYCENCGIVRTVVDEEVQKDNTEAVEGK